MARDGPQRHRKQKICSEVLYEQYWPHMEQVSVLYLLNTTVHEVLRFSLTVILRIFV